MERKRKLVVAKLCQFADLCSVLNVICVRRCSFLSVLSRYLRRKALFLFLFLFLISSRLFIADSSDKTVNLLQDQSCEVSNRVTKCSFKNIKLLQTL
jgi:hypothetical protein